MGGGQGRWGHRGCRGFRGVWGESRAFKGGSRQVQGGAKNTKKPKKRSGTVWLAYCAATSRILWRFQ